MAGGLNAAGRPISPGILNRAVTGGAAGAGALALSDIVEDPFGAPSRALTGAAFGGALGAGGALGRGTATTFNEPMPPGPALLGMEAGPRAIAQRAASRNPAGVRSTVDQAAFGAGARGGATQYIYPDGRTMTTMRPEAIGTEFRVGSIVENPGQVRKIFLEYRPRAALTAGTTRNPNQLSLFDLT